MGNRKIQIDPAQLSFPFDEPVHIKHYLHVWSEAQRQAVRNKNAPPEGRGESGRGSPRGEEESRGDTGQPVGLVGVDRRR